MLTDEDLQTALRRGFHEHADPVAGPPARADGLFRRGVRVRRRQIAVRAVSVSAAVAVAAGAVALTLPGGQSVPASPGGQSTASGVKPPGLLLAAARSAQLPASAAEAGMPRYYVTAQDNKPTIQVRDSATGRVLSAVKLPKSADTKLIQVAAAASDRRYVVAAPVGGRARFETLRVLAGGRRAQLKPLNVPALPAGGVVMGLAVSPDGRRLAAAVQQLGGEHGYIEVVTLATGAVRRWTTSQRGIPASVSWADHGRELGFFLWDAHGGSTKTTKAGLWELDPAAPGHGLLSGRRIVPGFTGGDEVDAAMLAPDGRTVIAAVTYAGTEHVTRGTVTGGIVTLSVRTGRVLHTLLTELAVKSGDPGTNGWYITSCSIAGSDPSGAHLLASCTRFGRIDRGRFTPLPGEPAHESPLAAW
jgi:hypothetical protein